MKSIHYVKLIYIKICRLNYDVKNNLLALSNIEIDDIFFNGVMI